MYMYEVNRLILSDIYRCLTDSKERRKFSCQNPRRKRNQVKSADFTQQLGATGQLSSFFGNLVKSLSDSLISVGLKKHVVMQTTHIQWNKKVLLREYKRHTARRVASARYAALSSDKGVGGQGGTQPC